MRKHPRIFTINVLIGKDDLSATGYNFPTPNLNKVPINPPNPINNNVFILLGFGAKLIFFIFTAVIFFL